MQNMDTDEQNFYPSYHAERIKPAEPAPSEPVYTYVQPKHWRCRMCSFLVPTENTYCLACDTPRPRLSLLEIPLIAFTLIFFFCIGVLLFLMGAWNDSPVPLAPELVVYQKDLINLSLFYIFLPPVSFFFLRFYGGKFATIGSVVGVTILLGNMRHIISFYPLSSEAVYNWRMLSIVVFSIFFIVPLVSGILLNRTAMLRRKASGFDTLPPV